MDEDIPNDEVCVFSLDVVLIDQNGDEYLINDSYSYGQAFANYSVPISIHILMSMQVPIGSYTLKFRSKNTLDESEVYWIMNKQGDTFAINVNVVG
ncbi:hypothetical protein [Providencia alcalifaciens]|uniref:hypothetical protein n=1 Tax=Providencia alcalifaciens TaxID=126385 RepID=UPI001CC6652B|nr:hypothetical protein [Providencia alcalifaciens]CAG9436676.1 hypothetical protein NVI2019_KOLGMIGM_04060 [Providencia alcalifaciens]CAG9436685.1 hypothetical protein NVI2019_PLFLNFOB_04058 [Providencia alcalifaciens]CAG9436708.1 hypothetical protein NVI2019_ANGEOOBF_04059 [Providencia alcalifaciens]CAG9436895.1 hypothetical protein NVI2019_OGMBKCAO_04111 [Providencia alcalifaciens]CAG9437568.1 hypothetical protein NVI2019_OHEONHNH_04058 [Providencia alcalifaciens]